MNPYIVCRIPRNLTEDAFDEMVRLADAFPEERHKDVLSVATALALMSPGALQDLGATLETKDHAPHLSFESVKRMMLFCLYRMIEPILNPELSPEPGVHRLDIAPDSDWQFLVTSFGHASRATVFMLQLLDASHVARVTHEEVVVTRVAKRLSDAGIDVSGDFGPIHEIVHDAANHNASAVLGEGEHGILHWMLQNGFDIEEQCDEWIWA